MATMRITAYNIFRDVLKNCINFMQLLNQSKKGVENKKDKRPVLKTNAN
jgi:hypothetical protein